MASVRHYAINYPKARVGGSSGGGGGAISGGNTLISTAQHALDGAEHTTASDAATLNASATEHGLMPKLSGSVANVYRGNGTQAPVTAEELTTVETNTALSLSPNGLGGVVFSAAAGSLWHPVMAQDPSGAETNRWWVVVDGSGTAVMAVG